MVVVKICGIMNHRDAYICAKNKVDIVGLVVEYPIPVPWSISAMEAKDIIDSVSHAISTCIVTGGSVDKVLNLAKRIKPDYVQLHYNETLEDTRFISGELKEYGIKTIKALRIDQTGACAFEIKNPLDAVMELEKTDISAILIDSYRDNMPGGTGAVIDLELFVKLQKLSKVPLILAGGIRQDNISDIISQTKPYAVDILTGVEDAPGCKSERKIAELKRRVDGESI